MECHSTKAILSYNSDLSRDFRNLFPQFPTRKPIRAVSREEHRKGPEITRAFSQRIALAISSKSSFRLGQRPSMTASSSVSNVSPSSLPG